MPVRVSARAHALLELADDELVLGWRDSEWTGIAPSLEEDVAFSSIAQNEIGHARALYELAARELGTTADELAFDRPPAEYRCSRFVELRLVPEWDQTIVRHYLYEVADGVRIEELKGSDDSEIAGLAAKIDREEVYHRIHAEMWIDRLRGSREADRADAAAERLYPLALGMLDEALRPAFVERVAAKTGWDFSGEATAPRGEHDDGWEPLWQEMTEVRRSEPGAQW